MVRWRRPALRLAVPLSIAFVVILLEEPLAAFAQAYPGVLPVAMVSLLACLLMPAARRWLIVTLCFGIGLLAWRDVWRIVPLPPALDYVIVEQMYPFGWALLALLALTAGVAEALRPGSVWARRCYFAAAAVYFAGHGFVSFFKSPNWQSAIMLATGIIAVFGIFTAQAVVAAEEEMLPEDDDIRALVTDKERRVARLADREWREAPDNVTPSP